MHGGGRIGSGDSMLLHPKSILCLDVFLKTLLMLLLKLKLLELIGRGIVLAIVVGIIVSIGVGIVHVVAALAVLGC